MRPFLFFCALFASWSCRTDKSDTPSDSATGSSDTGGVAEADLDQDGFAESEDCDDLDAQVFPGAAEVCDEIDNDCDGEVDEADAEDVEIWYLDSDGDGFGDQQDSVTACYAPEGYVAESKMGFDCDDSAPDYHPGADESDCTDPNDYNCDGSVAYEDVDGDGWAACEECNDADADVRPDATEICDEIDNDCDGDIDDGDSSVTGTTTWFIDFDGDGFGYEGYTRESCVMPSGYTTDSSDCDDGDPNVNPSATEVCNEMDDDCDGDVDDDDLDLDPTTAFLWYIDDDGDGFGSDGATEQRCAMREGWAAGDTDCDDGDADVHPDAAEICNGIDDDCDESVDDDDVDLDPSSATTWYIDYDGDGFGSSSYTQESCEAEAGWVASDSDCDDTNPDVNPDGTEVCNEIDDDCDGDIDADDADLDIAESSMWYADDDGDGFGDASDVLESTCSPEGYVADDSDCDDSDASAYDDNGASSDCAGFTCLDILSAGHSTGDGSYWIDPDGSGAWEAYCDMTSDDGMTLVGVAIYGNHGSSGWNDEASLNIGSATDLNAHWHLSSDLMNTLATSEEYRAACFDSSNNYTRYWWGVNDYHWGSLTSATESWDSYDRSGSSHATYWASHHYGLVSGANETDTLITAHSGHQWACGGYSAPGGEGYTGRGGTSSFRLWAK